MYKLYSFLRIPGKAITFVFIKSGARGELGPVMNYLSANSKNASASGADIRPRFAIFRGDMPVSVTGW